LPDDFNSGKKQGKWKKAGKEWGKIKKQQTFGFQQ
jgi:hypothetical protein